MVAFATCGEGVYARKKTLAEIGELHSARRKQWQRLENCILLEESIVRNRFAFCWKGTLPEIGALHSARIKFWQRLVPDENIVRDWRCTFS